MADKPDSETAEIAKRLDKAWRDAGFRSATEAAKAAGVPQSTFADHLNGRGARGLRSTLDHYAVIFGTTREALLGVAGSTATGSLTITLGPLDAVMAAQLTTHSLVITMRIGGATVTDQYGNRIVSGTFHLIRP
jgi:hypothetical protein